MSWANEAELVAGRNRKLVTASSVILDGDVRCVKATAGSITITMPAANRVPFVIVAVYNSSSGTISCVEACTGEDPLALTSVAAGRTSIYYSSGVSWHRLAHTA